MASLKDLRRRIRTTKSMQQIFKAMEMVAAAKLRRAQTRAHAAAPYAEKIREMLENLTSAAAELEHPLFKARPVQTTALVVIAACRMRLRVSVSASTSSPAFLRAEPIATMRAECSEASASAMAA